MEKTIHRFRFLLTIVACFTFGFLLSQTLMGPNAHAQKDSNERRAKAVAYEYCSINSINTSSTGDKIRGTARICYMLEVGVQCQEVEATVADTEKKGYSFDRAGNDALAKAISKLGNEGWEMIGKGTPGLPGGQQDAIYFKRQKQ